MKIKCVTFNLKGMGWEWFGKRFDALISQLKPLDPDIVCLQESTISYGHGRLYNQARAIGEAVGLMVSAFAPYGNPIEVTSRDRGGVALASHWPISDIRNRRLCAGHNETHDVRVAMFATLLSPEGPIEVMNTHFSWKPEEADSRLEQMKMVLQESSPRLVLCGDFNATEDEPAMRLIAEHFKDAFRVIHPHDLGHTWDNDNPLTKDFTLPNRRIDYVFCPKDAVIHRCNIVLNQQTPVYPSDHYGVMAELEW